MTRKKLTSRLLDSLAVAPAAYDVFDSAVKGFHVRVHPSGVMSFALRYRDPAGGKPPRYHRFTIGAYGSLTPDEAREIAQAKRAEVDRGLNPVRDDRLRKSALTFDDVLARFVAHLHEKRTAGYATKADRALRAHCAPLPEKGAPRRAPARGAVEQWGPRPVASITREEVAELHARMHETPALANYTVRVLASLFSFAQTRGWLPATAANPARHIAYYAEKKRDRVLTDHEAAKLGDALRTAETTGTPWQAVAIVRLVFLTGMRREEAATLRWDAVDTAHRRLLLAKTKTGRSERPLGAAAAELLEAVRAKSAGSPYVFPSPADATKPYASTFKHWQKIREAAELPDVLLHTLRHDVATEAGMAYPLGVLMAITGHADAKTASRYLHQHDDPTKRAADDVSRRREAKLAASPHPAPMGGKKVRVGSARP
ncbi:MAG: tyrosine-type recombinase/integrase [Gemmatimonadaceae bacterium]